MLEINDLSKSFGSLRAVNQISLKFLPNQVVGLLGPNGAGKSTTMRMAAGFLIPDSGTVRICGYDIRRQSALAQAELGYLPEAPNGFGHLRVVEFLRFCGQARGLYGSVLKKSITEISDRLDLFVALDRPLSQLSKGWRQRIWLAQAVMHKPRVLVLDEPTDGLDPNQKDLVRGLVRELRQDRTVILSTHILEEVEELCDRVVVLDQGRCVADSPLDELVDQRGRLATRFRLLTQAKGDSAMNPSTSSVG